MKKMAPGLRRGDGLADKSLLCALCELCSKNEEKRGYMKNLLLALLALLAAVPAFAAGEGKESTYDRVLRTGVIQCGYIVYPKQVEKDPNTGVISGVAYDVIEEAAKQLGFKVEWAEEVGTATFVEGLKLGRFDLLCNTAFESASRARYIASTIPVFHTPVFALARADDARFGNDLNAIDAPEVKVGVIDGSQYTIIAQQMFPKAQMVSLSDMTDFTQLLQETETGKVDVGFADLAITKKYMASNPGKLKTVGNMPVRLYSNAFLYRRGDEDFGGMIDVALRNLHNFGIVEKILQKHEDQPGIFYRAARPYEMPGR
jgi:ABC-type amino acid transport substrate-binding protein